MKEKSAIFKYISNTTYTSKELNTICLNYEKGIKEQAVLSYRENREYHRVKKIKEDIVERDKFFNKVLEYFEDMVSNVKEEYKEHFKLKK